MVLSGSVASYLCYFMLTCALSDDSSHSFRYSRAQPWITEVLVGAETLEQLQELIELCKTPPLTADQVEEVDATLPKAPPDLLNPGKWLENPTYAGSFGTGFLGPEIETPPE